ncbi:hypothetical protein CR513_03289, partial [Mucuna pruriens]
NLVGWSRVDDRVTVGVESGWGWWWVQQQHNDLVSSLCCVRNIYMLGKTIGRFYVAVAGTVSCGWVFSNAAFESYFLLSRSCIGTRLQDLGSEVAVYLIDAGRLIKTSMPPVLVEKTGRNGTCNTRAA